MFGLRAAGAAAVLLLFASGGSLHQTDSPAGGNGLALGRELPTEAPAADLAANNAAPLPLAVPPQDPLPPSQVLPGYVYWKTIQARVTAYEPSSRSCGKSADGITSLGDNAWRMDGCAVDPRAIPYRTMIEVPGLGMREADDTGAAMRRSWDRHRRFHIDIRFPYVNQARQWGVQTLDVRLYRKEKSEDKGKE